MSQRLAYSLTLVVLGVGYLFAMIQIWNVHAGRDGEDMLSAEDLRIAYSGAKGDTRLEAALKGPMQAMLPAGERQVIMNWAATDKGKATFDQKVQPVMNTRCISCHNGSNPHIPKLTTFEEAAKLVERDTGMNIATLVRVSHIHTFGMTFIFFIVSSIFVHAYIRPTWLKCALIAIPFLSILLDIGSWYLTKLVPGFAWVVIASGALMGTSFAVQVLVSLYQMWTRPPNAVEAAEGRLPLLLSKQAGAGA
jgi:hypothetical protein